MCRKARKIDEILISKFHQGPPAYAGHEVRMHGCNLYLHTISIESLANRGRPCMAQGHSGRCDAAVLCGAGHNLRMILRKLRLLYAFVLVVLLNRCGSAMATV